MHSLVGLDARADSTMHQAQHAAPTILAAAACVANWVESLAVQGLGSQDLRPEKTGKDRSTPW